jgi:hypothetical protein
LSRSARGWKRSDGTSDTFLGLYDSCPSQKAVDSEYEVAWVDGVLGAAPRGSKVIPLLPRPEDTELPHKAALVGTLKLSDFKQTLAAAGVPVRS